MAAFFSNTNETNLLETRCYGLSGQVHSIARRLLHRALSAFVVIGKGDGALSGNGSNASLLRLPSSQGQPSAPTSCFSDLSASIEERLCCTKNGLFSTFADPSCKKDHNGPGNRSKMVHSARLTNQRAEWTKRSGRHAHYTRPLPFTAGSKGPALTHVLTKRRVFGQPFGRPDQPLARGPCTPVFLTDNAGACSNGLVHGPLG